MKSTKSKTKSAIPLLPHLRKNKLKSKNTNSVTTLGEKIRIRNYVNLYSTSSLQIQTRNSTDRIDLDHKAENLPKNPSIPKPTLKNNNNSISSITEIGTNTSVMQRKCTELVYEIQKALSDKLELMRDLATYEYDFSVSCQLDSVLQIIKETLSEIPDQVYENNQPDIVQKIVSEYPNLVQNLDKNHPNFEEAEIFGLRHQLYSKVRKVMLFGNVIISDVPCSVKLNATQWLEEMEVTVFTTSGKRFDYPLKPHSANIYLNADELQKIWHNNFLSKFYFGLTQKKELDLRYDELHTEKFKAIITQIRGFGKCCLILTVECQKLLIQVTETPEVLEVPEDMLRVNSISQLDIKKVKEIVKKHIYYDKFFKAFYLQEDKNAMVLFVTKENNSKFLNEEYLKEALSMKRFKLLYEFDIEIQGHIFKIEFQRYKEQIRIKIEYDKETIEIPQESRYFKVVCELQCFNILTSPVTLHKSLELQVLIKKQFPKLFRHLI